MRAERAEDPESVGDRGDAADALQRGEDLAGIEEQIGRLSWILAGGNADVEGQLPNGTLVTLRFPDDGEDVRMRVVNYIEQTPAGAEDTTLTADSPLGLAGLRCMATLVFAAGSAMANERIERALACARELLEASELRLTAGATSPHKQVIVLRTLSPLTEPAVLLLRQVWAAWRREMWGLPGAVPRLWNL
jgi:hypothetical protein